jgi:hypothetical protein
MIRVSWAALKTYIDLKLIYPQFVEDDDLLNLFYIDGALSFHCVINKIVEPSDLAIFNTNYRAKCNDTIQQSAFANPTHQLAINAASNLVPCVLNATATIDFVLPSELFSFGAELSILNAVHGDWVESMIYDVNSVIPAPARVPPICEAWPIVKSSIIKRFVPVKDISLNLGPNYISHINFDSRPMLGKISAGLSIRVVYHAVNSGETRSIAASYFLAKKI